MNAGSPAESPAFPRFCTGSPPFCTSHPQVCAQSPAAGGVWDEILTGACVPPAAGSDAKRGASKRRCPTGECDPAPVWVKASRLHTLIPRGTDRWKGLYHSRGAVEREFGVLKHEWAMLPLRVRRLPRVRLHVDLTILAQLADAVARAGIAQAA
jgi:hypothetical protein